MSERIVSDSTCLIALERIGNVEILRQHCFERRSFCVSWTSDLQTR